MNKSKLIFLIIFLLPQCGKKRRNFFEYKKPNKQGKINHLAFPAVKGAVIHTINGYSQVKWTPIKNAKGYFIYKFQKGKFIRKKPINKKLLKQAFFIDKKHHKHDMCYIIRGVFQVQNQLIEGPSSKILYIKVPPT